jgi:2-keto-4-pentenoate hydratase
MDLEQVRAAASILSRAWLEGRRIDNLPETCRPATLDEGYRIQAELQALSGQKLWGWKIAATSLFGQKHIGVDGPLAGRLLQGRVGASPSSFSLAGNGMRVIEAEFAFSVARDLPDRGEEYSVAEVMDAVAGLHPAIEIPDSRFEDYALAGAAQLVADNACASYFCCAPASAADWRAVDLSAHPVSVTINGKLAAQGSGANVLGDPRVALTWLANELVKRGMALRTGQVVTTGTTMTPAAVVAGDHVTADFGALGKAEVVLLPG